MTDNELLLAISNMIVKWSQSLLCVENMGFNGIQKCVLCYLSFVTVLQYSTLSNNAKYLIFPLYRSFPKASNSHLVWISHPLIKVY